MDRINFWNNVKYGASKLGIPDATFRTWKSRGRVSRDKQIELYRVLLGTEFEISLEQFINQNIVSSSFSSSPSGAAAPVWCDEFSVPETISERSEKISGPEIDDQNGGA
jgi:hypothetical protein